MSKTIKSHKFTLNKNAVTNRIFCLQQTMKIFAKKNGIWAIRIMMWAMLNGSHKTDWSTQLRVGETGIWVKLKPQPQK